ncbi:MULTISPECIES: hypothetical protein [unclassified Methylobacterium]|jgi:ElaB/YqjD/DUF883 family membrane-anchored ribosome-binding protein|uniref:hypothetical protein n=1 Tax=unclassified Methylobacterium TaxID=2615210 RepID=UPI0011C1D210|nr:MULTISPECIES: hypothetical protein [unclassified Methylobacterium]QEE38991.1 hypothetical protein FVA80_08545 [Methylobacterium sp. WL1]TXN53933.1 hypothetical protein FV241_26160 [Methylobacterium sp. WL2]
MTNAADELEQDVEASRGRLDRTLGDLQSRLQGPGIPRDLGDLKRSGQAAGEAVERFVADVRVNPVPALLIAAGLGLLVYDVFRSTARRRSTTLTAGFPAADRGLAANQADRMEERLDEALEESFPGSDPVSVRITK